MTIANISDVEMADAQASPSRLSTKTLAFPRELPRPASTLEVNADTLKAIAPELADKCCDMEFVRDCLAAIGPE